MGGLNTVSPNLSNAELYDPATGTWTATGPLNTGRASFTATLLQNGEVLVAGGYSYATGHPLSITELYDSSTGSWTTTGALNTPRYYHTAALLPNGKVLVVGGQNPGDIASAELYDPETGGWTLTGALNIARERHTETLLSNGKVLVAGGAGTNVSLSSAELYDPATGIWTMTDPMNTASQFHTATLLPSGKVLISGGYLYPPAAGMWLSTAELYDPVTGTWTLTSDMHTARCYHSATLLPNGKVLVAGGDTFGDAPVSSAELFDPATETWTSAGSMNNGRNWLTATLLANGNVLVAGGANGSSILSAAELFLNNVDEPKTAASITTQPQSQTAKAGSGVVFSVIPDGSSPLSYQWYFNGGPISGATSATLTLNPVGAADSGGYSVVVSNPYGSARSVTASLAVLTDGANGNAPTQASPSQSSPTQQSGFDSLILVTHGFAWDGSHSDESWVNQMANAIQQKVEPNWTVVPYIWSGQAWGTPGLALINATVQGQVYGTALGQLHYKHIHLIGHSAGAAFVEAAAKAIKAVSPTTEIHSTFLDPYTSLLLTGSDVYGVNANWADCYSAEDWTGGFTDGQLENAYNVDVSWLDPSRIIAPYGFSGQEIAISSHGWPVGFYMDSVTNTDSQWCGADYGFYLSKECGGWNNRTGHPIGHTPEVICGSSISVRNPNAGVAGSEAIFFDVGSYALSTGANLVSDTSFALNSIWTALPSPLVKLGKVQPMGDPVPLGGNSTNSPAWLAVGVTITNAVNLVQFDAGFTDTNGAQGLLTVYWNTNQVGMLDERVASTNLQTYRFDLPSTATCGLYTLSFRLDSFNNSSSIAITNVSAGFVGATQAIKLGISFTNGAPLLQLTAATNFTYLIQSSTNLLDWTPKVFLSNTNGTMQFMGWGLTNSGAQFYRALTQ